MNKVLKQNLDAFVRSFEFSFRLSHKTFLITGATGLIGSILIRSLIALNQSICIVAPVRNIKKGKSLFSNYELNYIRFIECDLMTYTYDDIDSIDYIIHCASPTSSSFFVNYPVETFDAIYFVTHHLLEYARNNKIESFVYLSSLEIYGTITDDSQIVTEDIQGYVDLLNIRSCYPIAKRAAENLCCLYADEYGVNVKIARLTQTTGAGVFEDDDRVIVQFCRRAVQNEDIILHSLGNSARPYCYTLDCVSALLYILLKGKMGEAYNVANEDSYISAKELALYIKRNFNKNIGIRYELNEHMGYAPESKLRLSTKKLQILGWNAHYTLYQILDNLIRYFYDKSDVD